MTSQLTKKTVATVTCSNNFSSSALIPNVPGLLPRHRSVSLDLASTGMHVTSQPMIKPQKSFYHYCMTAYT